MKLFRYRLQKVNWKDFVLYLYMFFCIFCAGTPIYTLNIPLYNSILLIITIILCGIYRKKIYKSKIALVIYLFFPMIITMLINFDVDIIKYFGMFVPIFTGCIAYSFLKDKIEVCFVRTMITLECISLVGYFIGLLIPSYIRTLPNIDYRNFKSFYLIQIYEYDPMWAQDLIAFKRNCGMFREPGMYAVFLVIVLMILMYSKSDYIKSLNKKNSIIVLSIITLLTTFSTTGIIGLLILFLGKIKTLKSLKYRYIPIVTAGLIMLIYFLSKYSEELFSKFMVGTGSYISYYDRVSTSIDNLLVWSTKPIFGVGISAFRDTSMGGSVNSITTLLAEFGIVSTIVFLAIIYMYVEKNFNKGSRVWLFLTMLCIFSQQVVVTFPLAYILLFSTNKNNVDSNGKRYFIHKRVHLDKSDIT